MEADLITDRSAVPDGLESWRRLSPSAQRRQLQRLAKAEQRRAEFESLLAEDPELASMWSEFPVTEQREILSTIDYLRWWPRRREVRRATRAVSAGSDYRRKASGSS